MKDLGYETRNTVLNLGSLFVFVFIYFVVLAFYGILVCRGCKTKWQEYLKKKLIYKEILLISIEGYLEFLIAGYLNWEVPFGESKKSGEIVSNVAGKLSLLTTFIFIPCLYIWLLTKELKMFKYTPFREKWGEMYEGVKTKSKACLAFYFIFILRKIVFVLIAFNFHDYTLF